VQNCFDKYGVPELVILEKCSENKLNYLERVWQIEFNSIEDGLDLVVAGQVGYGYSSNNSKYSKLTILKIFSLLSTTNMTQLEISNKVKVPKSLVSDIKKCKAHYWLKDFYPARYEKMKNRVPNKFKGREITIKNILTGEEVKVSNLREFARDRGLPEAASSGLGRLRAGTRKKYKDWILLN
jgi:hypothetical protein